MLKSAEHECLQRQLDAILLPTPICARGFYHPNPKRLREAIGTDSTSLLHSFHWTIEVNTS